MKIQENGIPSVNTFRSTKSIEQAAGQYLKKTDKIDQAGELTESSGISFQDILNQKRLTEPPVISKDLKFSKHAAGRLMDRNIELTPSQVERLSDGTRKAGLKGIKDSLVLMDQLAFIVNVPNNTVVTALDRAEAVENIFTNIDGAIIL